MADTLRQRKAAAAEGEPAAASAADDKLDKVRSSKAVEPDWLTRHERFVPFALFLVAAFTRFYRLDKPAGAWVYGLATRSAPCATIRPAGDPNSHAATTPVARTAAPAARRRRV